MRWRVPHPRAMFSPTRKDEMVKLSIPTKHHYLPEFFLQRWAPEGYLYRFDRPRGADYPIFVKKVTPSSAGWKKDLYTDNTHDDPLDQQRLELKIFQEIDDRAATAITALEEQETLLKTAKADLARFVMSLLHRSPSRVQFIEEKLRAEFPSHLFAASALKGRVRAGALHMLERLIDPEGSVQKLSGLQAFGIKLTGARHDLLLSDCPVMISNGIGKPDGFVMFPVSPRRLFILANHQAVAAGFGSYAHSTLVRAINDAIVTQAKHLVIATNKKPLRFIEKRLLRVNAKGAENELDGLIRWKSPVYFVP